MRAANRLIHIAAPAILALAACRGKGAAPPEPSGHPVEERRGVVISTESQAAIGLRVERLRAATMPETMRVVGRILQDAQTCHHIPAKSGGTVKSIAASLGQKVSKGMELAVIGNGLGEETPVVSDYAGVVTAAHAAQGDAVVDGAFLFSVTEIDPLWGVLDIHEGSLAKIRVGQSVEVRTAAYPDTAFHARVTFVSPEIDPLTRTVKARVSIANPDGRLKLGMFLDASVRLDSGSRGLFVPREAVQTGPEGPFVFVRGGPTEFHPVRVSLGREQGDWAQLLEGPKAGDAVVVSGAFLVKSEMLKGRLEEGR
jgi:multidrug efflux pump subunit AcrA (membrane-fusion protein)